MCLLACLGGKRGSGGPILVILGGVFPRGKGAEGGCFFPLGGVRVGLQCKNRVMEFIVYCFRC